MDIARASTENTTLPTTQTSGFAPSHASHAQAKLRAVLFSWLIGTAVIIPDVVSVILANSVMLFADLLKTISETLATFLSWLALRKLYRGDSTSYDYGQGKLENLSSLAVALALFISWVIVIGCAVNRFLHPSPLGNSALAFLLTGASLCTNVLVWRKNYQLSRVAPSPIVEAQWRLYRAKSVTNIGVLVSLLVSVIFRGQSWAAMIDPVGAFILSGFLLYSGYQVMTDSIHDLLDRTLEESMQMVILAELAKWFQEYEALHGIRSRRSGTNIYIEIFMEFEGARPMSEVQQVINRIRQSLEEKIKGSHVVIAPTTERVC